MEKLFKFFEFNLELEQMHILLKIKRNFNNDLNLMCCFLKDYLSIQNSGVITQDENLYNDFVLFYEKYSTIQNASMIFSQLYDYSNHYLTIIFEETSDDELATALSTINACFALDCYPFLMELIDDYNNKRLDSNSFYMMLQSLVDIVLKRFENPTNYNINLATLGKDINNYILSNYSERLVG